MHITLELISSCAAQIKKRRQETSGEFLKRLTHLHLNGKHISKISSLDDCVNLEVLYLYDNEITQIENISTLNKLSHLYLQDNYIAKISNLDSLSTLQKLSLDHNCISIVEGVSKLVNLTDLYVSAQKRTFSESPTSSFVATSSLVSTTSPSSSPIISPTSPDQQQLQFDSLSLTTLARSLNSLHCASNNMSDLQDISKISNLTYLDLSQNNIADFEALANLFAGCKRLQKLVLKGNPISKKREYRETVITMSSPALGLLDDKEITANERVFLEKKAARKIIPTEPATPQQNISRHGSPSTSSRNESRASSSGNPKRLDSSVPKLHGSSFGK